MKPVRERTSESRFERLNIRWHGEGFEAATAAMLLAEAVIAAGGYALTDLKLGPEQGGDSVQAFTRIGPSPLPRQTAQESPDVVVILDRRLLAVPAVIANVTPRTWVLVSSAVPPAVRGVPADQVIAVDASRSPDIPNVALLAAVVARFTLIDPRAFLSWLKRRLGEEFWPEVAAISVWAAYEAMKEVRGGTAAVPVPA